ncbi:MAG TPA: 2-hydroxychromene-2-carboxylate isomerase [Polyangiaceae bacterium]
MNEPLRFYFDFISPYAYLAWKRIGAIAKAANRELEPIPILFAGLLNHHGQKGPAEIPAKRVYTFKNVVRLAHFAKIPLVAPPAHPFNPLLALRAASVDLGPAERVLLIDTLYDLIWGTSNVEGARGVTDPAVVTAALDRAGLDGSAIVTASATQAIKDRVRERTDEAIARGIFGVPTTLVDGELFWGVDSLPHLEAHLRGEDPAAGDLRVVFGDVPVGTERKR